MLCRIKIVTIYDFYGDFWVTLVLFFNPENPGFKDRGTAIPKCRPNCWALHRASAYGREIGLRC